MVHKRCCMGPCNNDSRYPEKLVKRGTVENIKWHKFPQVDIKFCSVEVSEVKTCVATFIRNRNLQLGFPIYNIS